ncbi:MATH and LRR domain-containing protein PFE0570w-like [Belonocnema kinseyi]|uniref:MATH and LRR domain-containing protein PFE0570w-like n=1 Tax=Belonocnema kinseyi TaxID=2817044 RepID=UPI00143DFD0D|nr:MATH and LRR domain-containing protein PFE0570w-like [Belonocnema kinseyi]
MRLYLIATILLITICAFSEVSTKQIDQKLKDRPADSLDNKRRLKRQEETAKADPNIAHEKDVTQTEHKEAEGKVEDNKENDPQKDVKKEQKKKENKSNDSSNSESSESGEKKAKVRRSIVQNDVSDSKSDESKANKKRAPRLNKIRRSLDINEPDSSSKDL